MRSTAGPLPNAFHQIGRDEPSDIRRLFAAFESEGLLDISDESIDRAIARERETIVKEMPNGDYVISGVPPLVVVDGETTRMIVRTSTSTLDISRYCLDDEVAHYKGVSELGAIWRCVRRVYEIAGIGQPADTREPPPSD